MTLHIVTCPMETIRICIVLFFSVIRVVKNCHVFSTIMIFMCAVLQFVSDGVFKAELNEFLTRELAEDGYSGVEVRVTPTRTEIIILATR